MGHGHTIILYLVPSQYAQPGVLPRAEPQSEEAAAEVLGSEHGLVVGEPEEGDQGRVAPAQAGPALRQRGAVTESIAYCRGFFGQIPTI